MEILFSSQFLKVRAKLMIVSFVLCIVLVGCSDLPENVTLTNETTVSGEATIHFIDVGQGDATLLQGPNFTVLIDAGRHDRNDVVPYLTSVGVKELDLLIGTHPHADHIGQMDKVMQAFPVKEVWMSGDSHTSKIFERVLNAIFEHEVEYYEPRAGEQFDIGSLHIRVVNPVELTGDLHDGSISLVATYGDISILLTGDAEKQTEAAMLDRKEAINAHIFQLGHHGSSTSSTEKFVKEVNPEIVIYSAGADNSYGHPHQEVIELFSTLHIPMYGTIKNGTIVISTDGLAYTINADQLTSKERKTELDQSQQKPEIATSSCLDINNASIEELLKITHIGKERAEQLINLRPFKSIDELSRINGIGEGRLKDIKAEGLACVR
ncbi:MAG: MBL fold metallo-hydrolase [Anaerobacillus sp.]|uniref:MBL fold metallo-hydrolase n=1 Tax=Anaerobacillus sp. TaxID=1872506 RepID=UPI00391DD3BD